MSQPKYFLAKSEPGAYSIQDLARDQIEPWDGVHNYQAVNVIKSWSIGDLIFFYHSMGQARIVGLMEVVSEPKKDESDPRGISWVADVKFIREYPEEQKITLKQIKATEKFQDFALVRQSRLSVMECPEKFVMWLKSQGLNVEK